MIALIASLLVALSVVGCLAAGVGEEAALPDTRSLLVTVGEVTDSTAVLWVRGQSSGMVHVRRGPIGRQEEESVQVQVTPTADLTSKVPMTSLAPSSKYRYLVEQGGDKVEGEFVTAPPTDRAVPVKFLWSGDLGGGEYCRNISDGYPIFRTLARFAADFFLFVGDTIYADHICAGPDRVPGYGFVAKSLQEFRDKHRYNRAAASVQEFFRRISVYAIWDDHEVKNDFSGVSEALMPVGRQAFLEYFPIHPPSEEPGRLYRRFRWGSLVELFILDTRQYRRPNHELDGPNKTMLGTTQREWLVQSVTGSTATWKVVVSSVSLSVPSPQRVKDSWSNANILGFPERNSTGFALERDAILRDLRKGGVKNLVFIVADAHHAQLIRLEPAPGWPVYEFIAGPLAASLGVLRPLDKALNPRSLFGLDTIQNFGEVTVEPSGLTVRIVDMNGRVRVTHALVPEP